MHFWLFVIRLIFDWMPFLALVKQSRSVEVQTQTNMAAVTVQLGPHCLAHLSDVISTSVLCLVMEMF